MSIVTLFIKETGKQIELILLQHFKIKMCKDSPHTVQRKQWDLGIFPILFPESDVYNYYMGFP